MPDDRQPPAAAGEAGESAGAGVNVPDLLAGLSLLAGEHGFAVREIGQCQDGPLLALERPRPGAPRVYLSAGVHGDEPAGPLAVRCLLEQDALDHRLEWRICPLLNPGGLAAGTRTTPCGRDLNRDYASRHSAEAQAHAAWLERQPIPDVMLSLHEDFEATGVYLYEINTSGAPSWARTLLDAAAAVLPVEPAPRIDDHHVAAPGWILHPPEPDEPGWPEAILLARLGPHVSYTMETPSRGFALEHRVAAHAAMVTRAVGLAIGLIRPSAANPVD